MIGWLIGWSLWATVEPMVIPGLFPQEKFDIVTSWYRDYGVWCVFVAAFTPVPYKVFTLAAGVAGLPLPGFIAASFVGRGARFFLVAGIIRRFGDDARAVLERHFNRITWVVTALVLLAAITIAVLR